MAVGQSQGQAAEAAAEVLEPPFQVEAGAEGQSLAVAEEQH